MEVSEAEKPAGTGLAEDRRGENRSLRLSSNSVYSPCVGRAENAIESQAKLRFTPAGLADRREGLR